MTMPETTTHDLTEPIAEKIGSDLQHFGGLLRCVEPNGGCGRELPLGSVGDKLAHGWPKCCGYTMRWITERQFESGEYQR